jgi:homoserine/homoserine lactone efflux protein
MSVNFEVWLLFCATETLLCLTPGPAVLLVVSLSLTGHAGAGVRAALGILAANAFYFGLSATGVGALLLTSWQLFFGLKWLGAAYLAWLGLGMLLARSGPETRGPVPAPARAGFRHGFLSQAANPKSLLFCTAILPQFIDPAAPLAPQIALLGISSIVLELAVLCAYAQLAARGRRQLSRGAAQVWIGRAGGALLLTAALRLASLRRPELPAALP